MGSWARTHFIGCAFLLQRCAVEGGAAREGGVVVVVAVSPPRTHRHTHAHLTPHHTNPDAHDWSQPELPLARIKKIMKSEDEIKMQVAVRASNHKI